MDHILYKGLPGVADKLRERMMRLAGHCGRHLRVMANKVRWRDRHNTGDRLQRESRAVYSADLLMQNRKEWRSSILESRVSFC